LSKLPCPQCHKGYRNTQENRETQYNVKQQKTEHFIRKYEFCSNTMCHLSDPDPKHNDPDKKEYWQAVKSDKIYDAKQVEAFFK